MSSTSIPQLADEAMLFYAYEEKPLVAEDAVRNALKSLKNNLSSVGWERAAIGNAIKGVLKESGLKMPQRAMPLRQAVTGVRIPVGTPAHQREPVPRAGPSPRLL